MGRADIGDSLFFFSYTECKYVFAIQTPYTAFYIWKNVWPLADLQILASVQVYASIQVSIYMHACKYASMQEFRYASV